MINLNKTTQYLKHSNESKQNKTMSPFLCLAYGMSRESCKLILSYLRNRLQRVKIVSIKSDWSYMIKGVPRGSVLGPLLFTIFLNDIYFVLSHNISIYNYADDNTIGSFHEDIFELKRNLEMSADITLTWFNNNQMKVNPEKFQTSVVKKANEVNEIDLNISGQTIKPTSCVKLLGLFIDDQLTFDKHVSELCMRVARQTNALRRNVKYLTPECKIIMYTAFIASNFNYCHIVWHFCGYTNSLKIEKLHKKSLNVVLNDYLSPYHVLLEKVKRPTMYVWRMKSIGFEVFKCLHNCSPSYITDMFRISATPYDTRGGTKFIQPKVNTTRNGLKSFRYQGAKIWNELPTSIKNTEDVSEFKYRLNEWPCPVCKFKNIKTVSCHNSLILHACMILSIEDTYTPFAKSNGRFFQTQKLTWCLHPICTIFGKFMKCILVVIFQEKYINFWH